MSGEGGGKECGSEGGGSDGERCGDDGGREAGDGRGQPRSPFEAAKKTIVKKFLCQGLRRLKKCFFRIWAGLSKPSLAPFLAYFKECLF